VHLLTCLALVGVPAVAIDRRVHSPTGRVLATALAVWAVLGGRSLARAASEVGSAVDSDDLAAARVGLPSLCGREPSFLDADGLVRAAVESVAENTSDAVVAPLVWGAVAGVPGLLLYRAVNTLDAMVGHRSERYTDFGMPAARLDDVVNWVPARLAAGLAVLFAPLVGGRSADAVRAWRRDAAAHPSPNAGRVEAAFAGALGVQLGGPVIYPYGAENRPLLGDGRPVAAGDVARAVQLSQLVGVASAVLCAAAVLGVPAWRGAAR
jgi:adenosylcobinamide-phosphate synthase